MINFKIKILSFFTVVCTLFMVNGQSVGAEQEQIGSSKTIDGNISLINSCLCDFNIGENTGTLYLTDAFDIYLFSENQTASNCSTYFLIDTGLNELIGEFDVYNNGQINFVDVREEVFNELYTSNQAFAFGFDSEGLLITISEEDEVFSCYKPNISDFEYTVKMAEPVYKVEAVDTVNSPTVIAMSIHNDVRHVSNEIVKDDYDEERGICWAAAIAMKANREISAYANSNLSAMDVYKMCIAAGLTPTGSEYDIEQLIRRIFQGSYHKQSGAPTAGYIYLRMCENKTIFSAVSRYDSEKKEYVGHAILAAGIKVDTEKTIVYFADPNYYAYHESRTSNDGLTVPECMTHTLPLLYPSTAFNTSPPSSFYYNWLYTIY